MADPKEGLPSRASAGGARQKLEDLRERWGAEELPDGTVRVSSMTEELWSPLGTSRAADAWYQLEHRRPA